MAIFFYFRKMKYRTLTREQLEEFHLEFSKFLALQSIGISEWTKIKKEQPKVALGEINVFSDLVWEKTLNKVQYLEHVSNHFLNLFFCEEKKIHRIVIQCKTKDFLTEEDFNWIFNNLKDKSVELFTASKSYNIERNTEIFKLIETGATISKGEYYTIAQKMRPLQGKKSIFLFDLKHR